MTINEFEKIFYPTEDEIRDRAFEKFVRTFVSEDKINPILYGLYVVYSKDYKN